MARQRGVGLIELMISIAIGLILVVLVSSYYLSSRQSYQSTVVSSEVTDSQRYAVRLITKQLLLAGYRDYWFSQTEFLALPANGSAPAFADGQIVASKAGSDDIWIRFRPAALQNQEIIGCNNQAITEDIDKIVVVQLGVDDDQELFCQRIDNGGAKVPLLDGVEAIAFEYLDDSGTFQPAAAVMNWASVRAVRLNLILRSASLTFDTPTPQSFDWPNVAGNLAFNDNRMRARVARVVALRNL
ncbi:PilW family protein [Modicisalibacter ilicicola]|uniref:PilW family protein n=1 Tax=Modicisalibacter ilicicola TaxID=480814 RepID=UPI0015876CB2|nr:PilW family protein [Halomonas ilicicola]